MSGKTESDAEEKSETAETISAPQAKKVTIEVPQIETADIPKVETPKLRQTETQEVPEIGTAEVQESQNSTPQTNVREQIEGDETLDLAETITQSPDIVLEDAASLVTDPLYREYKEAQLPKYQRLDVKLYVLLRDDQLEFLARLTREIMKHRASEFKKERITKNTIIRALIDNLKELELNIRDVPDETVLAQRIADSIRSVRVASLTSEQST